MEYIAIDIGNTMIKYALISLSYQIEYFDMAETPNNLNDFWNLMESIFLELKSFSFKIQKIGISCPGCSHEDSAKVGGRIKYLYGSNIKKDFENKFNLETYVLNDGKCAGLAEFKLGSALGRDSAVVITIGTAIAGAIFLNNTLLLGSTLNAGEFSWYIVRNFNCKTEPLFKVSSISAMCEEAKKIRNIELSGFELFKKAKENDSDCEMIIKNAAYGIADLITNMQFLVDPSVFCVGGFLCSDDYFLNLIKSSINEIWEIHRIKLRKPEVISSYFKGTAGLIGAVINCQEKEKENE